MPTPIPTKKSASAVPESQGCEVPTVALTAAVGVPPARQLDGRAAVRARRGGAVASFSPNSPLRSQPSLKTH